MMTVEIVKKPAKLLRVVAKCRCGKELRYSGYSEISVARKTYEHRCSKCAAVYVLDKQYPYFSVAVSQGEEYKL